MCCRVLTRKGIYTLETRLNVRSTSSVSFLFIISTAGLSCRSCTGSSIISVFMKVKYYSQPLSYNDIIKYKNFDYVSKDDISLPEVMHLKSGLYAVYMGDK